MSRGHPYMVGDVSAFKILFCNFVSSYFLSLCGIVQCGRVVVQNTCNVCGATIGGTNYIWHMTTEMQERKLGHLITCVKTTGFSSSLFSNDTTQAGYSLGMPEGRSTAPSPERSLSPAACCLVRALMHSALLWASCNNEVHTQNMFKSS